MENLKFKVGDIIYRSDNNKFFEVLALHYLMLNMYKLKCLNDNFVFDRNKDVVEKYCIIAPNQQTMQVLFGTKV